MTVWSRMGSLLRNTKEAILKCKTLSKKIVSQKTVIYQNLKKYLKITHDFSKDLRIH